MTKIKVSTHDWDTKNIDMFLEGNVLHVNIGDDENSVDLSTILPKVEAKPDYHLSSGSFDPLTKSIKLIASAEGEPDKETAIPLESLFGLIPTIEGAKGDKGDDGQDGENGVDGRDGVDGKSAYQIWLDIGNTGSESDFINSLKGEKGEKGDRGNDGSDGKAGSNLNPATLVDNKTTFFKDGKIVTKRPECYHLDASRLPNGINDLPIYNGYSCYTISVLLNPTSPFNMTLPEPMRNMVEPGLFVEVVSGSNLTIETVYARTREGLVVYSRSNSLGIRSLNTNFAPAENPPYFEGEVPPSRFTERWGSWSRLDNVEMSSSNGIDLANLPTVSWKDGTSILVKQDGELKQLVPIRNLFQEVGVAMTGRRLSGLTGETYHVVVTVTNSGEATNEVTDLVITKPLLGTYRVENFTNSKSSGVTVEKLTDLTYKIKNLNSGGTAKVEFDVIPESVGSFQFGASINPNNVLDQQSNNNQSTITLSAQTPTTESNVTADCPLITAFFEGTQLLVSQMDRGIKNLASYTDRAIVFSEKTTLNGVSLTLENVSSVSIVETDLHHNYYNYGVLFQNGKYAASRNIYGIPTSDFLDGSAYTFELSTGRLTINKEAHNLFVILNPKGTNCNKQYLMLSAVQTASTGLSFETTAPTHTKQTILSTSGQDNLLKDLDEPKKKMQVIGSSQPVKSIQGYSGTLLHSEFIEVTVPKDGQEYTITASNTSDYFVGAEQQGNLKVNGTGNVLTFTASSDSIPVDTFKFKNVILKVV